jgi:hypothetical protein
MKKKIVRIAPIYSMGKQVDTFKTVMYIPMTEQEMHIRIAGIAIAVVAVMFIIQSII